MANFFEGVWEAVKHPFNEAQFLFDVGRGKIDLKDAPGEHQRMMNKITVPILGDNKIAKNSDAVAGAIVGSVLAAPVVGSALSGAGSSAISTPAVEFYPGGGMFQGNTAAPVVDAIGESPLDSILVGGGDPSEVGSIKPDKGLPWADIVQKGLESIVLSEGDYKVSSSAHRPGFRGANIPAMQYDQYALGNQMSAQKWSNVGGQGGTGTEVSKDINQLLGMV